MSRTEFVKVLKTSELSPGQGRVVRVADKQIALFQLGDQRYYAIDNRCPHEGYPLVQGTITDCVLTCDWHNWKFDLNDGNCLRGGENVRAYPVRVNADQIEVDLTEPPNPQAIETALNSLRQAMSEGDDSRAARDILRLLKLDYDQRALIAEIACYGASHDGQGNDFHGWDHGMAVLVDCARVCHRYPGFDQVVPLTQGLSAVIEPRLRQGYYPLPEIIEITEFGSIAAAGEQFRNAVENEEPQRAAGILRGAIKAGVTAAELKDWLFTVVTDHFLSYGHRMIYAVKAVQLLDLIGWQHADALLPSLVMATVWGTREDRLPYMRKFQARLNAIEAELPALFACQQQGSATLKADQFRRALLDGTLMETFDVVDQGLRAGVPAGVIAREIVLAAAERCLRFNLQIDRDRTIEEGWLDITHCLTLASAVREALEIAPSPALLRGLYQAARLVQYTRQPTHHLLDLPPAEREAISDLNQKFDWAELTALSDTALLDRLVGELDQLQHQAALSTTRGYLELGHSASKLSDRLIKYALADSADVAIMLAHTIKTTVAAVVEFEALADRAGAAERNLPLLAAVRFLASPKRQRWTHYGTLQAIDFVINSRGKE